MKKPNLDHAEIIKGLSTLPESVLKLMTPAAIAHIEKSGAKEIGTNNMACGKFATDGSRSELSVFRMVGGCNHLHAFDNPGAEKSEDYDSLPDEAILWLPDNFGKAVEIIEQKYIGGLSL